MSKTTRKVAAGKLKPATRRQAPAAPAIKGTQPAAAVVDDPLKAEVESMRQILLRQQESRLSALPSDKRAKAMKALEGVPLAQAWDIIETLVPTEAAAPRDANVNRAPPARTGDGAAPRSYAEWKAMPEASRRKYRDMAQSLPD